MIAINGQQPVFFYVAGIGFDIQHIHDGLLIDKQSGSRLFFDGDLSPVSNYRTSLFRTSLSHFPKGEVVFAGQPWGAFQMPYKWQVVAMGEAVAVTVAFDGNHGIDNAMAVIDHFAKSIDYYIDSQNELLTFDVYENPLGILMTIYLAHFNNGLVIHASGVNDNGNGYLFTGISGIGKSTMAGLWQREGAKVVNDDRLVIMPAANGYTMANTPMHFYVDEPKVAPLSAIFLLSQSPINQCKKITGAKALTLLMANCMQHFHSKTMVNQHLDILNHLVQQVPVYELGFKPDGEVVEMIRQMGV